MTKIKRILIITLITMLCVSCQKTDEVYKNESEIDNVKRDELNAMQAHAVASDGNYIYMELGGLVYRIDAKNNIVEINCDNLLCDHEGELCSARLPDYPGAYNLVRDDDSVYVLGNEIYKIGKNSKKEVGKGYYGDYGCKTLFNDYIGFFKEPELYVVEAIKSGKEIQRFEDITGFIQGNFYYNNNIYIITSEQRLVRLNLETGEIELLEKKGATRASLYNGFVYYVKVSELTDSNQLIKLNPNTLEKEVITEGVFYYNMQGDTLYYSTYPERKLFVSELNGSNPEEILLPDFFEAGGIYAFSELDTVLVTGQDIEEYYVIDKNNKIDYDNKIVF